MMATKQTQPQAPGEIELLLPWYAAGTLGARDVRRVEEALARDPELTRQYAVIQEEYAATIDLNESLGAPSAGAMQRLFEAIDHEPVRKPSTASTFAGGVFRFFAGLSPRTLAWSGSIAALLLVFQAGVIGVVLTRNEPAPFQTSSLNADKPITRALGPGAPPCALVRFAPNASIGDVIALLDRYQASIVDLRGGMFRLQIGNRALLPAETADLIRKLQGEKIVGQAVAAP